MIVDQKVTSEEIARRSAGEGVGQIKENASTLIEVITNFILLLFY